jgi:hypothetical protein
LTRKRIEYFLANTLAAERAEVINLSKIYPEYKQFIKVGAFASVNDELDRLLAYAPAYRRTEASETLKARLLSTRLQGTSQTGTLRPHSRL